jgi:MFS family permease
MSVVRVSSGNFLEMYDFMVFGYYASAIARTFFPSDSEFASLMLSLMTFGAGFLMRPLGAIVLGAYVDHHGRRAGLLLTLGLMSLGTLSIACLPGYATIGLVAPILVVIGRLLQGFSRGWSSAACRSTCRRSRRPDTRASTSAGNPAASRWRSSSRHFSASS